MKKTMKRRIKDFLYLNLGVLLISVGYVFIQSPNNQVYGGVQGISIILNYFIHFEERASYFLLVLNVILLIISLIFIGKEFFFKTLYASIAAFVYAWCLEWFLTPEVVEIVKTSFQNNGFLFVVGGAVLAGFGLGLAFKSGASTGGMDIVQQLFYKYLKLPYSASLIILDGTVVLVGSILLHHNNGVELLENLLYAIIFIIIEGNIQDLVAFGGFNVKATYIICDKKDEVKKYIIEKLERGVTEIPAVGGYTNEQRVMLLCILPAKEYYDLKDVVMHLDPNAFIFTGRAAEVHGEGFSYDSKTTDTKQ